jgi:hypothetical protein
MKKMFSRLPTLLLLIVVLTACAPVAQGFVELPDGVKNGITSVVLVAVSFGLAKLITLIPLFKFLDQYREPVAYAIALALIEAIQAAVPDAYGAVAVLAIQLVLAIQALFGIANTLKQRGYRFFQ